MFKFDKEDFISSIFDKDVWKRAKIYSKNNMDFYKINYTECLAFCKFKSSSYTYLPGSKVDNSTLAIRPYINPEIKMNLHKCISDKNFLSQAKIKPEMLKKLNVIYWDNFFVQFAEILDWRINKTTEIYTPYGYDSIMWNIKTDNRKYKEILSLFDKEDLNKFFYYLKKMEPKGNYISNV